jgi:hypothetical protein
MRAAIGNLDSQTIRLILGVVAMAVVLAVAIGARRVVDRFVEHGDPRIAIAGLVVLWAATTILVEMLLLLIR